MSWQLASFLILGAVLLGGFAWYERSRPPSQVVALVAALAALAIAGRIAFAAFPNVKPTTDIVVFAGYALGPAPGFAVGALAGLVSNFWFGQGPWTPWQMAGWGLCGVLGAALALGARNAGRLTLAAVCGFAGIAYGVLLNFSLMATYGGDLSLAALPGAGGACRAVRRRSRDRQRRLRPARRAGDGADAGPLPRALRVAHAGRGDRRCSSRLAAAGARPGPRPGAPDAGSAAELARIGRRTPTAASAPRPATPPSAAITGWAMLGLEAAGRNPLDVARGGKHPGRLPALEHRRSEQQRRPRPHDRRPRGRRCRPALLRRPRPGRRRWSSAAPTTAPSRAGRGRPPSASIALRTAGAPAASTRRSPGWAASRTATAAGATCPAQPSNADVTGAAMQAMPGTKAAEQRALLPAQAPAPQRRLRPRRLAAASTRSRPPGRSRG